MPRSAQTGPELPLALSTPPLWLSLAVVVTVLFITDLRAPQGALASIPNVLAVVTERCGAHDSDARPPTDPARASRFVRATSGSDS